MQTRFKLLVPLLAALLATAAGAYTAKITRSDIIGGGGRCTGNLCTINGKMYDCSGGGYCVQIRT